MNSILIGPGLPGGMMGSLMADLEKNLSSLNNWLAKRDKPPVSQDKLLLLLFKEVEYVWPQLGYPPLVTPFSQYVKNVALMNVIQMLKGKGRWTMIDENTWGMILGRSGKLPGKLGIDIIDLAQEQGREFYKGNPQDLYPDELEIFAGRMDEYGWSYGKDDEELFEYAMHPQQYEDYKSGKARKDFLEDLKSKRLSVEQGAISTSPPTQKEAPKSFTVEVNGEKYAVSVSYDDPKPDAQESEKGTKHSINGITGAAITITAPLEGKFFLTRESGEKGIQIGDEVKEGDTVAYIESMKVINAITSDKKGRVMDITVKHGDEVEEDDILIKLAPI
jgi:pyruvate carboxylase subunit B